MRPGVDGGDGDEDVDAGEGDVTEADGSGVGMERTSNGDDDDLEEDDLEALCERVLAMGVMDECALDALTDAIACGATTEAEAAEKCRAALIAEVTTTARAAAAAESPAAGLRLPTTLAIVLDTHYLSVAAKAFSVRSGWSVSSFEASLVSACGGGRVVARYACDSAAAPAASPQAAASHALHDALRAAGYTVVLSPPKASGMQGATDIDVACCMFRCAGAFADAPLADTLVLVAGDAEYAHADRRLASACVGGRGGEFTRPRATALPATHPAH